MWPFKPSVWRLERKADVRGLIRALAYKRDARTRAFAARALGKLELGSGAEAAGAALTAALRDPDSVEWEVIGSVPVCAEAAAALAGIRYPAAVPGLIQLLQHPDVRARRNAADALGFQGERAATRALLAALKDEKVVVRHAAVVALRTLGDPESSDALIELLRGHRDASGEEVTDVHCTAAEALGKLGEPRALPVLIEALSAPHYGLRVVAVDALGMIEDPRVKHALSVVAIDGITYPHDYRHIVERAKNAIAQIDESNVQ
jgi:HEAT repeat protein